jgi:hypothetical protein
MRDVKKLAKRCLKCRREMFTFILVPEGGAHQQQNRAGSAPVRGPTKDLRLPQDGKGSRGWDVTMRVLGTMKLQGKDTSLINLRSYILFRERELCTTRFPSPSSSNISLAPL